MRRILVVLPFYGGSLPIGRYCAEALRSLGCVVEVFDAPGFFGAYTAIKELKVALEKQEQLQSGFITLISRAVLAKVEHFDPDLVLAMAQAPLDRQTLMRLRKDGVPTAMWFVEDFRLFTYWQTFAPYYDIFAVIQKEPFLEKLAALGVSNTLYLPLAAMPSIHRPLELTPAERALFGSDISFMGAGYPNRRTAFRHLARRNFKIWGTEWEGDTELAPLVQRAGERISTEDTVRIFNASRINLNLHSSINAQPPVSEGDFVNPRTFEIAACGAFQLVDKRGLLAELFDPEDVAVFDSLDALMQKIDYFLARPEEREAFAARGRKVVLERHTYTQRMRSLLDFARTVLPARDRQPAAWPDNLPESLKKDLAALLDTAGLPPSADFDTVVAGLRSRQGNLAPLETALLFLDEWKKYYLR